MIQDQRFSARVHLRDEVGGGALVGDLARLGAGGVQEPSGGPSGVDCDAPLDVAHTPAL